MNRFVTILLLASCSPYQIGGDYSFPCFGDSYLDIPAGNIEAQHCVGEECEPSPVVWDFQEEMWQYSCEGGQLWVHINWVPNC